MNISQYDTLGCHCDHCSARRDLTRFRFNSHVMEYECLLRVMPPCSISGCREGVDAGYAAKVAGGLHGPTMDLCLGHSLDYSHDNPGSRIELGVRTLYEPEIFGCPTDVLSCTSHTVPWLRMHTVSRQFVAESGLGASGHLRPIEVRAL